MFKIYDGREAFYQWDIDQKVVVDDRSITQVHFCNRTDDCALICECYEHEGNWVADVPNILLQDNWRIRVYAYDGCATRHDEKYDVKPRSKPDTYVYTETEVLSYETISKRMDAIETDIEGVAEEVIKEYLEENDIKVDLTGYATEEYVDEAISAIELTPGPAGKDGKDGKDGYTPVKGVDYFDGAPGTPGKDGAPGKDGQDGYTPVKGVDYFDGKDGVDGAPGADGKDYVLTQADKEEIASMVEVTGGGGSGEGVEEVYIGTEEPADTDVKIWVDPDEDFTVNVDGTSIIQNEDGTISTVIGGSKVIQTPETVAISYEDATGFTRASASNKRYTSKYGSSLGGSYLDSLDKYTKHTVEIEFRNASTNATGTSKGTMTYVGTSNASWSVTGLTVFDDTINSIDYANGQGIFFTGVTSNVYEIYYITKFNIIAPPVYDYEPIDAKFVPTGNGLIVDVEGKLTTPLEQLYMDEKHNLYLEGNVNDNNNGEYCVALGTGNSLYGNGNGKVALGRNNSVYSSASVALGDGNKYGLQSGYGHVMVGYKNVTKQTYSLAVGGNLIASSAEQCVYGKYNIEDSASTYNTIIGNGTSSGRANGLTINGVGDVAIQGTLSNAGADYAEYFEWADGNPNREDRVGLLVTLEGNKIRFAKAIDDVLGIVSGTATVLGDDAEWVWQGKYLRDDFGRIIMEDVEVALNEEKTEFTTIKAPAINPEYDESKPYVSRANRPEWDAIGMMGKLFVKDDGTCVVNGYAMPGENGVATLATGKTSMRVMERISDNIVRVLLK